MKRKKRKREIERERGDRSRSEVGEERENITFTRRWGKHIYIPHSIPLPKLLSKVETA